MIWYEEDVQVRNAPDGALFWIRGVHDANRVTIELGVDHLEKDGGPYFVTLFNKVVNNTDPSIDELMESFGAKVERLKDKTEAFDQVMRILSDRSPEAAEFVLSSTRAEPS